MLASVYEIFILSATAGRAEIGYGEEMAKLERFGFEEMSNSTSSFSMKDSSATNYQTLCGGRKCKIAVVACASSRGIENPRFDDAALVYLMLPSLLRTAETDRFTYAVYIGIDEDDPLWNDPVNKRRLEAFVKGKTSGKYIGGRVVSFPQPSDGKKRIPMNEAIKFAYDDGADYIVRINDDTEFITKGWTSAAVGTLLAMGPPNVGVVGPTCPDGKVEILTHDMVHRTHVEIFEGYYYPPVFENWYLDDWITEVYGQKRTRKLPYFNWEVRHHINHHGTRYVATGDTDLLKREVQKGKRKIDKWFERQKESF